MTLMFFLKNDILVIVKNGGGDFGIKTIAIFQGSGEA